ncbi:MAG: PCRF domain-containing protein, partial [Verrucomicrobia bacterium]
MIAPENIERIENIKKRTNHLWKFLDVDQKLREIEALEAQMGAASFWDNNERAQKHIGKVNVLKRSVLPVNAFRKKIGDLDALLELIEVGSADEQTEFGAELATQSIAMQSELDELEISAFLTGQFDRNNAIFSIQSGAGGTESNDWADMMFRMYSRWAERRG